MPAHEIDPEHRSRPKSTTRPVQTLRTALGANALSVITAAVALLVAKDDPSAALGGVLLAFGALCAYVAYTRRPSAVLFLSLGQLALAGAAVVFLLARGAGALPVDVAVLAALLALAQLRALRGALREQEPGLGDWRYCLAVDAQASPVALWRVVGRVGDIARYMPELASSELRGEAAPGVGAVRACRDRAGVAWAEAVTRYDAEVLCFEVRFLHEEAGFPFPVEKMFGGWRILPQDGGSRVEIWWSLTPSARLFPWLVVALMGLRVDRSLAAVVARMDAAARGEPVPVRPQRSSVAAC
jgi:hypothetical protein